MDKAGPHLRIRAALPGEAAELSALALESKARWGYGREWLDRWAADARWNLEHLWVRPAHLRQGVGSGLLQHALQTVRASGQHRVVVTADPNAAGFYERAGGVKFGALAAPLPGDPGRRLPLYEFQACGWIVPAPGDSA